MKERWESTGQTLCCAPGCHWELTGRPACAPAPRCTWALPHYSEIAPHLAHELKGEMEIPSRWRVTFQTDLNEDTSFSVSVERCLFC